jgi:hypothetical protein
MFSLEVAASATDAATAIVGFKMGAAVATVGFEMGAGTGATGAGGFAMDAGIEAGGGTFDVSAAGSATTTFGAGTTTDTGEGVGAAGIEIEAGATVSGLPFIRSKIMLPVLMVSWIAWYLAFLSLRAIASSSFFSEAGSEVGSSVGAETTARGLGSDLAIFLPTKKNPNMRLGAHNTIASSALTSLVATETLKKEEEHVTWR